MSAEETQNMMVRMMDLFFESMNSEEETKEFMKQMMPVLMKKMMEGMSAGDKQKLMGLMMQNTTSMTGGSMMGDTTKQNDFRPLEFCPCYNVCEESFKTKHNIK